jgi:ABC-type phosphate transport system permease subunit
MANRRAVTEVIMRLNTVAMAIAFGMFWGTCVLIVGAANLIWPTYGQALLQICASIYPGYHPGSGIGSVIVGSIYALVDGIVGGAIFGWLYNLFAGQ